MLLIAVGSAWFFTADQPLVFKAKTTFVMRPRANIIIEDEETLRAVDTLSRRIEINTTFGKVASSKLIKNRAIERLKLSSSQRKGLGVSSRVIAGTNILEITTTASDPVLVRDFAEAVSTETIIYVRNLYDVFQLEPLDEPEVPKKPIQTNQGFYLVMGGILGLVLGIGLAFLVDYLQTPLPEPLAFNIIDGETGLYNRAYFMLRLRQEMGRAKRNGYLLSVALIKMNAYKPSEIAALPDLIRSVPKAARLMSFYFRHEDVLSYFDEATFAILMPDIAATRAKDKLEELHRMMEWNGIYHESEKTDQRLNIYSIIGAVTFLSSDLTEDQVLDYARRTLDDADSFPFGKVSLVSLLDINEKSRSQNGTGELFQQEGF